MNPLEPEDLEVRDIYKNLSSQSIMKVFISPSIRDLHDNIYKNTKLVEKLITKLRSQFYEIHNKNKPKSLKDSRFKTAAVQYQFIKSVRQRYGEFLNLVGQFENINGNDLLLLLQKYAEEVFNSFCRKQRNEVEAALTNENTLINSEQQDDECHERSILTIGGGCMGEVWRKSKRHTVFQKKISHFSNDQKEKAKSLYDSVLKLRRTPEEKLEIQYAGIKLRDEGGLFIPKETLNPYFLYLNKVCRSILQENGIKKFGHKILQAVSDEVTKNSEKLREIFLQCVSEVITDNQASTILKELQRKFMHALTNEFVTARDEKEKEDKNLQSKGCSALRDKLYVLAKKGKDKSEKNVPRTPCLKNVPRKKKLSKSVMASVISVIDDVVSNYKLNDDTSDIDLPQIISSPYVPETGGLVETTQMGEEQKGTTNCDINNFVQMKNLRQSPTKVSRPDVSTTPIKERIKTKESRHSNEITPTRNVPKNKKLTQKKLCDNFDIDPETPPKNDKRKICDRDDCVPLKNLPLSTSKEANQPVPPMSNCYKKVKTCDNSVIEPQNNYERSGRQRRAPQHLQNYLW